MLQIIPSINQYVRHLGKTQTVNPFSFTTDGLELITIARPFTSIFLKALNKSTKCTRHASVRDISIWAKDNIFIRYKNRLISLSDFLGLGRISVLAGYPILIRISALWDLDKPNAFFTAFSLNQPIQQVPNPSSVA